MQVDIGVAAIIVICIVWEDSFVFSVGALSIDFLFV